MRKVLVDENLASPHLVRRLRDLGVDAVTGPRSASDRALWRRARAEGCAVLTLDRDFLQRARSHDPQHEPPHPGLLLYRPHLARWTLDELADHVVRMLGACGPSGPAGRIVYLDDPASAQAAA